MNSRRKLTSPVPLISPKGKSMGTASPELVSVKLAKAVGFSSKEMMMPTCAEGWWESMVMGAEPLKGKGWRGEETSGKPPQKSARVQEGM